MRQWLLLFSKEQKEMLRNYKWIWVPLVFIILGMTQPITSYYLPEILENLGGLPEGAVFEIPVPTASEVLVGTLGQFSQIGILILVLATMGIVASERISGSFVMILVKPVSYTAYLTAKWASIVAFAVSSFLLGYLFSAYYTYILMGEFVVRDMLLGAVVYSLWLIFIMTLVLFFSSIMKSIGAIAFLTLGTTMVLSVITSLLMKYMYWSPARLSTHSNAIITSGNGSEYFWVSLVVTVGFIVALLLLSIQLFKKKELVS
ncbi:ABC transporter permease [Anaerobacillus alkaliphilus]|uniref:ABC transporter permease n=1 Tax=Anaerobacillus alkaliphilus TaxID=1548597 RepID=A0A4Q0VUY0_9BACI|nr:ABC transporter permease subunit [Anaerobacillus alkaliphilus]RXJ02604.1 ABC transporter permease [Anaerobacillus alkaliphilus]